jgi:arylsulfatase A
MRDTLGALLRSGERSCGDDSLRGQEQLEGRSETHPPMKRLMYAVLVLAVAQTGSLSSVQAAPTGRRPNLIFILADDLGYGDVRCLNPQGKISTPHMDRLAAEGMRFSDAHSSSSVCTPTRYGIMTGRYNWRSRLKSGVQGGMSPDLIEPGRATVASFLKQHGYHTACFGKWHLGFDWKRKPNTPPFRDGIEKGEDGWNVDFTKPFGGGPLGVGFDSFFGIAASLDMVPYTYLENDHVTVVPTVDKSFPMNAGKAKGGGTRKGPAAESFEAEDVLPELTKRVVAYIGARAGEARAGKPFFVYMPLNAPHTPIVPSAEWRGKSGIGAYGDFVMQTDATVGAVLDALEANGLRNDTLVVMTSDNGCSPAAGFPELAAFGHNPSYSLRGHKADLFDGGHRIPFIASWPGRIAPGSEYGGLACLNDWFATAADIIHEPLPENAAEDSVSLLPAMLGKANTPVRKTLVHHSIQGMFAIREGRYKLLMTPDSGGWSEPRPNSPKAKDLPAVQLYDLEEDRAETRNLQAERPDLVARLTRLLLSEIADGSTRAASHRVQP